MPDDADFIEKCELELCQTIAKMHKAGVKFEIILGIVAEIHKTLEMQSYCENWLNQFTKPPDATQSKS